MRLHGRIAAAIRVGECAAVLAAGTLPAHAQTFSLNLFDEDITAAQLVLIVGILGAVCFALVSAVILIRMRNRLEVENRQLTLEVGALKALVERSEALVDEEDQRLVAWGAPDDEPLVAGALPPAASTPADRDAFLAFGDWVRADSAARLDAVIHRLRSRGEPFNLTVATRAERMVEVRGRTIGGSAVVRFRDLSGDRLARARVEARNERLAAEVATLRSLLGGTPMPIWLRDDAGRLTWVNGSYAKAVDAADAEDAVTRGVELVDSAGRRALMAAHTESGIATRRLPTIVAGSRRIFDVTDIATEAGSAAIGVDVTEVEAANAALRREIDFNARTLDQLMTAVVSYGPDRRLKTYNAAFRALFGLDASFLDSAPEEAAVLDRLRAQRKLPEQADFRSWRGELMSAYRSLEGREFSWHLPDGQTLRVLANPHPQGGITWIYENVTERLDLESRYNALVSVQGETLDHLTEGVAVFGSDGRLRLHNPSFGEIWSLDPHVLDGRPHVAEIVDACRRPNDDAAMWQRFMACVAGLDETRSSIAGRMERADSRTIDYATVPLPDGQTMVTFVDVTDSVKVERALVEKNEALVAADALKNTFIHHVSYELRSPLTNIMGFAQLLGDARVGPLTDKQTEYVGYIMESSSQLLAIVNDILDLSSIDAGLMELDLGEVDADETVYSAIAALREKFLESRVSLQVDVAPDAGRFIADARRIRQILINLLSNAIAFSEERGRVRVTARRVGDAIEFAVADDGPGIPQDFLRTAFDRFASLPRGKARGGAGLGLSIVKSFVALHGGTVEIQSEEGKGAMVSVRLPTRPQATAIEAAE